MCDRAALSARCQCADTDVLSHPVRFIGSGKPSRVVPLPLAAARCADADVEVFAERPCRSGVSDRYGRRVAAANALRGHRHRGRCAADRGVVGRGAGGRGNRQHLAARVVEVVDDRRPSGPERRQRAGRADRDDDVARERGAGRERAPVAGGDAAAREARVGDVAAVGAGLDRAAQRRPARAGVDDVVRVGRAADWTLPISVGGRGVAVDDARAGEPLVASPPAMRRLPAPLVATLARRLNALPLPKLALS